jgi:pyridoxamine 5'-phosphate oxidase
MYTPIQLLESWITEERNSGAPNPSHAILATVGKNNFPHARVVAIREIHEQGLLFFTQTGTRKVLELRQFPCATMTFWFELHQRQVILEGKIITLTQTENESYWSSYSRQAQIRFYSYAETSSQPIPNKQILEEKRQQISQEYSNQTIPMSPFYCGFRLQPQRIAFYAYRLDELSDVFEFRLEGNAWQQQWISP